MNLLPSLSHFPLVHVPPCSGFPSPHIYVCYTEYTLSSFPELSDFGRAFFSYHTAGPYTDHILGTALTANYEQYQERAV